MTENLIRRLKQQGYGVADCCEFEYYDDMNLAADREKELNLKFNYPWSDAQDWRRVYKMVKASLSPKAMKNRSKSQTGKTHSEDVRIRISKTRSGQRVGENGPNNKLTSQDVLDIRSRYKPKVYTLQMLADEYNISKVMVGKIVRRERWTHI